MVPQVRVGVAGVSRDLGFAGFLGFYGGVHESSHNGSGIHDQPISLSAPPLV